MKTIKKQGLLFIFILSLAACTHPPTQPNEPLLKKITAQPSTQWKASGVIAAKHQKKGWNASFVWEHHQPKVYDLTLFGPMGGGSIYLHQNGNKLDYKTQNEHESSTHPTAFLYQKTGLMIPIESLSNWIRGRTAPGKAHHLAYYPDGTLKSFSQEGYTLTYLSYQKVGTLQLPYKIDIRHQQGFIKLVIHQWQ